MTMLAEVVDAVIGIGAHRDPRMTRVRVTTVLHGTRTGTLYSRVAAPDCAARADSVTTNLQAATEINRSLLMAIRPVNT